MSTAKKITAACYVRMSTDSQQDSPERQRNDLTRFAERQGYDIVEWYADHGISGTGIDKRCEFQRLMSEAADGRFDVLLACELSRLSREEPLTAMTRFSELLKAGIQIQTIDGRIVDFSDIGGMITTLVDSHQAHDESLRLAARVNSGKRKKLDKGLRVDGHGFFGYARQMKDQTGNVVKVVRYDESFARPPEWSHELIPDPEVRYVNAVRWMFRAAVTGSTTAEIAAELNRRNMRTSKGNTFCATTVRRMLENPVYKGILTFGKRRQGKFDCVRDAGGAVYWKENAHEALVDPATFDRVGKMLDRRPKRSEHVTLPLSGMIVCPTCGSRLYAKNRRRGKNVLPVYDCPQRLLEGDADHSFSISAPSVENAVFGLLALQVFTPENVEQMLQMADMESADAETVQAVEEIERLGQQIVTAERNLALASSPEVFGLIDAQLAGLRDRREQLTAQVRRKRSRRKGVSAQAGAVGRVAEDAFDLLNADTAQLRELAELYIEEIVPHRNDTGNVWDFNKQTTSLTVCFRPGVCDQDKWTLTNLDLGLVNCHESALRTFSSETMELTDIHAALEFSFTYSRLKTALQELRSAGLIEKTSGHSKRVEYRLTGTGKPVADELRQKSFVVRPAADSDQIVQAFRCGPQASRV